MNQLSLEFEKWASSEMVLSPMLLSIAQAVSDISSIHDTVLVNPLEYIVLQVIVESQARITTQIIPWSSISQYLRIVEFWTDMDFISKGVIWV